MWRSHQETVLHEQTESARDIGRHLRELENQRESNRRRTLGVHRYVGGADFSTSKVHPLRGTSRTRGMFSPRPRHREPRARLMIRVVHLDIRRPGGTSSTINSGTASYAAVRCLFYYNSKLHSDEVVRDVSHGHHSDRTLDCILAVA